MNDQRDGGDGPGQSREHSDPLERIVVALRRIGRALNVNSRRLASDSNVTSVQLFTMKMLDLDGVDTATELSRRVHLSPSTVVGVLDRLEEKGYIERRRDTKDRRVVRLNLTKAGGDLVRTTPHPVEDLLRRESNGLTDSEATRIADALETLVFHLGVGTVNEETAYAGYPGSD